VFRAACIVFLLALAMAAAQARHHHYEEDESPVLTVGDIQFAIPASWQAVPPTNPARVGQWNVPPAADQGPDGIEIVVYFFGPGVGGSVKDNIDAWSGTITAPDGTNAPSAPQKRTIAGHVVTEVLFTGTYAKPGKLPGLPPTPKSNYALLGAVVESPGGNIYWCVTGPAGQVLALAPILDKILDSLKPHAPAPAPKP
jgi:hypothetical protein